ncbi:class I SAM-dependent methyltransferase [candidate division KSB1 bacterium]|nr:class I SAM-dependent methyltransferase [candidate division KSB1 bacterium]
MKSILPQSSGYWKKSYITYRRLWLDTCLNAFADKMSGVVLDLGGKRENKRGSFQPPEHEARAWWYINLDWITKPNIFADVTEIPLKNASMDCILCTEVLEHLKDPQACVNEIHRLLRTDGLVFASTPFFYPVHADPYDFQRFTEDGLRNLFINFRTVDIYRMGGYMGVLGLLVELGILGVEGHSIKQKLLRWTMKWISRWLLHTDLKLFKNETNSWKKFTTGYFVVAIK